MSENADLLIFGQTGQVARELARQVPEAVFLDRAGADLSNPEACAAAIAERIPSAVINSAAYTAVDQAEEDETLATTINGAAPGAMARACAALDIPFVHISTDYVFDGAGTTPFAPGDPTAPLGAYGRSKLAGEQAVMAAGGTYAILRTSWVFSAHGNNFLKTMLRLSKTRTHLRVVADQIGGPTPASAIAAACLTMSVALSKHPGKTGLYHLSGMPDVSWAMFARAIFAAAGRDVAVEDIPTSAYPTPTARPGNSRLDCSTLMSQFGINRPDWQRGVRDIVKELT